MRIPFLVGNWKMNKTASEASVLVREFLRRCPPRPGVQIGLAPPFTALHSVREALGADSAYELGAQDMFWEDKGAFTGEISGPMLKDLGCRFVIIGHSERRQYFGEQDEWTNKKVAAALRHDLRAILCVGETLAEREEGRTDDVVTRQLKNGLAGLDKEHMRRVVVAYEPVWAIGTGRAATPEQALSVHRVLRQAVQEQWSAETAQALIILYGGSVTPHNIGSFLSCDDIDGALVGGACLDPASFATLADIAVTCRTPRG
ncbi:MAG TPA: triose-phosphate isomerase [Nitrospiraceae bacterium]|nr:triose-phosphate isomerase [Nitrospiraceae bacterium]